MKSIKETANGYMPFFEYALDYSPPNDNKANISNINKQTNYSAINSATLPYSTSSISASNNTSLPRNCGDMQGSRQQANSAGFMGEYICYIKKQHKRVNVIHFQDNLYCKMVSIVVSVPFMAIHIYDQHRQYYHLYHPQLRQIHLLRLPHPHISAIMSTRIR